ncbi:DNA polymerase III delta prime subunit [hydrothermal vent metagenome]|uniref:DNA polymerase III subunit delta' n=1 Tax=hydrothermal vent metagenome TaxID=652676 RepID=A0A3B0WYJ6_9ZZZZ
MAIYVRKGYYSSTDQFITAGLMVYPWQQHQWQNVQQQRQAERLPHGLLLMGSQGLGKLDFAQQLTASLLCQRIDKEGHACGQCAACLLLAAGTHPDVSVLQAEAPGKAIKVDDVRQLTARLNLTSQYGGYQVALIVDAHDMNINASNSLLKTLEEPTGGAVLVLVSSSPQKLPITVRSRCQAIVFREPAKEQALSWLEENAIEPSRASGLLNLAHGAPLQALKLQQSEFLEYHQQLITALLGVAKNQPVVDQAEQLYKLPLPFMLNGLYDWVQDLIKLMQCGETAALVHEAQKTDLKRLVARCRLQALYEYLDQLGKYKQLQAFPLNTQLLWEDLLLSWNRLIK